MGDDEGTNSGEVLRCAARVTKLETSGLLGGAVHTDGDDL